MKKFELSADLLYSLSKVGFFRLVPYCDVNFVHNYTQMFFSVNIVAKEQPKAKRVEIMAHILSYCNEEMIKRLTAWLTDYCSDKMQIELFDLTINDGKIILGKSLEKAIYKLNRKR